MKTLDDFDFSGKLVLLRTDLNSDVADGKVLMSERIKESAITINELIRKKARVVVIAHQGNPGKPDFISLKQHSMFLKKFVKIDFVDDIIGEKAYNAISSLKNGKAILLENIRFNNDEIDADKKDNSLISLAERFDIYVNDAFSVCHRNHSSIVLFPRIIKNKCAGRILEKEVNALKKIKIKECLYILGGAKPEENIKLLGKNKAIACGLFGQLCLVSLGKELGYQDEYLKKGALFKIPYNDFLKTLKEKLSKSLVETPVDFAVLEKNKRKEILISEFPNDFEIMDIGSKSIEKFKNLIKSAKAIYMKGPAGDCSDKRFCKGTFEILKAVSECKGFSLIGGGHLSDAIRDSGINKKKFGHISLSGGALLSYIAGEELPGLTALGK